MVPTTPSPAGTPESFATVEVLRLREGALIELVEDQVISEEPVTVMVDRLGNFTIMATPADQEALAIGFVFSEGLIEGMDEVLDVCIKEQQPNVVGIQIQNPGKIAHQRNMIVASSCGMCGTRNIATLFSDLPPCPNTLAMTSTSVWDMIDQLQARQQLFHMTGGAHAAAILDTSGRILAFAEDLGRHSALDKAIGKCLMAGQSPQGQAVALSGRISLEMVTKAARAGIELIAAVSAPSSLAVKAADHWKITLCGFVRSNRFNVYTHAHRLVAAKGEQSDT
ncbi:formate dehydrogenase accessory sulfurtransferase FdhD [Planctomycetota bacterium]